MVTVEINDKSLTGQRIIKDLRRHSRVVNFVEPNTVPKGYLTSDEFKKHAIIKVNEFCDKHGIL